MDKGASWRVVCEMVYIIICLELGETGDGKNCPAGMEYNGTTCVMWHMDYKLKHFQSPAIAWFYPTFGPVAGGTRLMVQMNHTDFYEVRNVTVVGIRAGPICNGTTEGTFRTITGCAPGVITGTLSVTIFNESTNETGFVTSLSSFHYLSDPVIHHISRDSTFLSGGLAFVVFGENITSVAEPKAIITAIASDINETYKTDCPKVSNSTHMTCLFPKIGNNTTLRQIQGFSRESIRYFIGFELDGVDRFEIFRNLSVHEDPTFDKFKEEYHLKKYEETVHIKGERLNQVLTKEDITVSIGAGRCDIISLASNQLSCVPPPEKPEYGNTGPGPAQSVLVQLSYGNVRRVIGYLDYNKTTDSSFDNNNKKDSLLLILGIAIPLVVVLGVVVFFVYCGWSVLMQNRQKKDTSTEEVPVVDNHYSPDPNFSSQADEAGGENLGTEQHVNTIEIPETIQKWIIDAKNLKLLDKIGQGQFGCVYQGVLHRDDNTLDVAVKTIQSARDTRASEEFLEEASVMAEFSHRNIVQFYGLTIIDNLPHVLLEFMDVGDLKKHIADPNLRLMLTDILWFAQQIADGMAYLAGVRYVHRDLAARNCMINTSREVKIADFGLSRDIYMNDYYRTETMGRPLPVRWMALESMEKGVYSTKSDVWSYGVVLWELFTRGGKPYADVSNYDLKNYVKTGRRLDRPEYCPASVYKLMHLCWGNTPEYRPSFEQLSTEIKNILGTYKEDPPVDGKEEL